MLTDIDGCIPGDLVVLEPLTLEHVAALSLAVADGELWHLWYTNIPRPSDMKSYICDALHQEDRGEGLAFVVRERSSGIIVGTTRICNWEQEHRRLEIGYTWYAKSAQRKGLNVETSLLLLSYAFETLDVMAVEYRTHWNNEAAREAISRLGAQQDGVLRNHRILNDGTVRDTVVYSIIESEWPEVKAHLKQRLINN